MFARKLLRRNKFFKSSYVLKRYLESTAAAGVDPKFTTFEPLPKKKPKTLSYIYSLAAGNMDEEKLIYPEQTSPRVDEFFRWLEPIKTYISSCTDKTDRKQILDQLRELEVFRTHIDEKYFGLTLSNTESLILVETLSNIPWLGTYITKNHILPVQIISKYGSELQKQKYFPRIISGELIPTLCMFEDDCGTNINSMKSYIESNDENSWLLNGQKKYVINGINSNLFLVSTRMIIEKKLNKISPNLFSLLLVERSFGGINCTNVYDTIGRHEIPACTISFTDTLVPAENVIGKPGSALNILLEFMKPGKQNISGQSISLLRNFTNQLIPDILNMKHFDRDFYAFDIVKRIVGEIIYSLYTMESMAYLTTGLMDQYEDQDAEVERVITEMYCANKCLECIQAGLQLVGMQSYLNNKMYVQVLHDALALTTMDTNNLDGNLYAAMAVIKGIAKQKHEHIEKKRKFLQYPLYNVKHKLFSNEEVEINSECIHPSLQDCIPNLENAIKTFRGAVEMLLFHNGTKSLEKYRDVYRITKILTELYATFANIMRASRSYSIGVRNSDIEKNLIYRMARISSLKIDLSTMELEVGPVRNCDNSYADVVDTMYNQRKYPMEHPLTKTY
ncbi:complex I assembly factor ACAD9, mitochondrial [Xylocopa sonorina]|uniref:complex I assembly factor ACAD9, mitochondrial n=1 Tax=Xylocopa sonorina TaxID=1818115 RepID=UPI00403ABD4F